MEENSGIKIKLTTLILILIIIIVLVSIIITCVIIYNFTENIKVNNEITNTNTDTSLLITNNIDNDKNKLDKVEFSSVDLSFLKIENKEKNKIYSPLSIKYALKMLEEAASGETKSQISKLIGESNFTKYKSNENFSFANAFFIRDFFKNQIKEDYITTLKSKYNAELKFDSFKNSENINNWIMENTLEIIPKIITDKDLNRIDFVLINALAINMEWEEKFLLDRGISGTYPAIEYLHEKRELDKDLYWEVAKEKNINVYDTVNVSSNLFNNGVEELEVSGMSINATINNYDIVKEIGEENIKQIVGEEYRKFAKGEEYDTNHAYGDFPLSADTSDEGIKKALKEFFPKYISELKENYHKVGSSTDFSIYTDKDVKIFAKDLKEYDDTTLQYVGIMPINEDLTTFIEKLDDSTLNNYISNLKTLEPKNFKEGVVTRIIGYIPKFNFEYELELKNDLETFGITDVFDSKKANLTNLTDAKGAFIEKTIHKANIEFTQDGIKAAAATVIAGGGSGSPFDYEFYVPVEEIDLTFDKPYMFLIRDIKTGEIWFIGTVYEPLLWENEPENKN